MYVTGTSASQDANNGISLTWDMNDVLGLHALTAGDFQLVNLAPMVTGLSQTSGAAGTTITITGQNFSGSAGNLSVFFGTQASTAVAYVDDSHITARVPAGVGTVDVTVQSGVNETDNVSDSPNANVNAPIFGYGTSATSASDLFTFSATLPATHLSASAPSTATAGNMFAFTVTALDMNNGTAAGYGGKVHFTSTDPLAVLPADYTFKPSDFGVHTFQITAGTAGSQTFTVSDMPDGLGSASASATVSAGAASLSRSTESAGSTTLRAGQTTTVTLTARDAFGNPETTGGLTVAFALSGMAGGTFGPVTDHGNGTYSAVFTATSAGMGTVTAKIGGMALTSGTLSFTITADSAPVIQPIGPISLPHTQFPDVVTVQASSPVGNPLTYSVTTTGDSLLFDLQQQYKFQGLGMATVGATAYVLHSNQPGPGVMGYYLIRPSDGALFAYDGSGSYAHSFSSGMPLATLGANVFTDPGLLMSARPPADYATLQSLQQQYQFMGVGYLNRGAFAYVLHSNMSGPGVMGYYLIRPSDGALFAYDGSGSYAHSFASGMPLATLGANAYNFPDELMNAQAPPALYAQLYQVKQQFDLQEMGGSFFTGTLGNQAQWLYSPVLNQYGQHWYTLTLSGGQSVLRAWQGYQDSSVGAVVATFDTPSVYNSPMLLTTATFLPNPAVTASITQAGMLTIGLPDSSYLGTFKVTVSVTDGLLSASRTIMVTSTDTAPMLSVQQNNATVTPGSTLSVPHLSFPLTDTITATGSGGQTVTTTASASSYSPLFALQQTYRFQGMGYANMGGMAYVLSAAGMNSFGNTTYLISQTGGVFAYDGSGNYATSFARTPLATLGASVYADPMLLMNAQPPVNYTQLNALLQQFHFQGVGYFNVSGMGYVLAATTNNSFGNPYYLLSPAGGLYAYDGTGSYAHTYANVTPVATLDPGVYVNPSLLLSAKAAPSLYSELSQAEAQFDLQMPSGGYATGFRGNAAKWLFSPVANSSGQNYYTLVLSANGSQTLLYAWDGGMSSIPAGAKPVAVFDSSVYFDPTLLTNAKAPAAATGVTATAANGMLTINAPSSFVGTFQVTVTTTDGSLTSTETFQIASTDTAPVPNAIQNQTASRSGSPLQLTLGSTDAENDPVTYTATAVGYSPAYNLQQQYGFMGQGYFSAGGAMAYVLHSNVLGGTGGFYLLSSSGGVYAYDGSGSYAHTFANSANLVAQLSPSVYMMPSLLTSAAAPTVSGAQVNVNNNMLTVNVSSVPVGTVFEVLLTASDGAQTQRTGFLVTVTA
jgi:hypothetical protein